PRLREPHQHEEAASNLERAGELKALQLEGDRDAGVLGKRRRVLERSLPDAALESAARLVHESQVERGRGPHAAGDTGAPIARAISPRTRSARRGASSAVSP